ncbi:MAG TPA: hypothetical protein VKQ71_05970 [Acidimicrobiales bacterium]|nr:hypothetical protein [Acidimicrobiales bacterium]
MALFEHAPNGMSATEHRADQVHIHELPDDGLGDFFRRTERLDAGVVDEAVDGTEALHALGDEPLGLVPIGNVSDDHIGLPTCPPDGFDDLFGRPGIDVVDQDARTLGCGVTGICRSKAAAAARNGNRFSVKYRQ